MNSAYWIKRIILIIPTVLLVVVLTFFLTRQSLDTVLDGELDFNELRDQRHPRERRAQYNRLIAEKGLDLPSFYFSIQPQSHKILRDVDDIRIRQAMESWLTQFDANGISRFFGKMIRHLDTLSSPQEYNQWFAQMIVPYQEWISMEKPPLALEWAKEVQAAKKNGYDGLPSFIWHGTQNQFHHHALQTLMFDFGNSAIDGRPVGKKLSEALIWTVSLSTVVLILSILLSGTAAFFFLLWKGRKASRLLDLIILAFYAMPLFWLATLCIVFLTHEQYANGWLNWFPSVGIYLVNPSAGWWANAGNLLSFVFLPILCMVVSGMAFFYLQWRDNGLEVMQTPSIITAKSKGLNSRQIISQHVLPTAGFSILGLMGFFFPSLISGSVIVEVLFNIPGMGRLMYTSIMLQDWNVVMAVVFIGILVSYLGFILADAIMRYLDPRLEF